MPAVSITRFASTAEGAAFYRAYDRVLEKWPVTVTTTDLDSEFGTTRVNSCGPEDAPPIVLLPGGGATSTVWFENVAALATRHRVHAIDLLGEPGRSVADGSPMRSADALLAWLGTVMDGLGLGSFALGGHSYGAMIALAFALDEPDRVEKLVLLDPNSCFARMHPRYLARALPLLLRPTDTRQRTFIEWETSGHSLDDDWLDLLARGAADFPASKTVVPPRPKPAILESLRPDTTVILASDSRVHDSRRIARRITETHGQIRVVTLNGATHHTVPMHPAAAVDAALIDALSTEGSIRSFRPSDQ